MGAGVVVVVVVSTLLLNAAAAWLVWSVALLAVGWLAQQRSSVATCAFDRALFRGAPLDSMHPALPT